MELSQTTDTVVNHDNTLSTQPCETTTKTIRAEPTAPRENTVYKVDVNIITPVVVCLIIMLMIVLAVRSRLEKAVWFQQALRTFNIRTEPPSRTSRGIKEGPQFDLPPEYAVALSMPKPTADYYDNFSMAGVHGNTPENNEHLSESSTQRVNTRDTQCSESGTSTSAAPQEHCRVTMDNEQASQEENSIVINLETNNAQDNVEHVENTSEITSTSEEHSVQKDKTEMFSISDHLHKMVFNPTCPQYYLPTYEEYIQQLPSLPSLHM